MTFARVGVAFVPYSGEGWEGQLAGTSPGELRSTCNPYLTRCSGCLNGGARDSAGALIAPAENYVRDGAGPGIGVKPQP